MLSVGIIERWKKNGVKALKSNVGSWE